MWHTARHDDLSSETSSQVRPSRFDLRPSETQEIGPGSELRIIVDDDKHARVRRSPVLHDERVRFTGLWVLGRGSATHLRATATERSPVGDRKQFGATRALLVLTRASARHAARASPGGSGYPFPLGFCRPSIPGQRRWVMQGRCPGTDKSYTVRLSPLTQEGDMNEMPSHTRSSRRLHFVDRDTH